jgi:uncharacterized protein (PEP-CTERM system associated)
MRRRFPAALGPALCAVAAVSAHAQAQAQGSGLRIATGAELGQSLVDVGGRADGSNGTESVTRVAPSLRITGRSGGLSGSLNYTLAGIYRTGREQSAGSEIQNALEGNLLAELVRGQAYVDGRASISQQAISAFGRPVGDGSAFNRNRTEVSTVALSPYLRGELGGLARYEARVTGTLSASRDPASADSKSALAQLTMASARPGLLGWSLLASTQRASFSTASLPIQNQRVNGTLTARPEPDLAVSASAGIERSDFGSPVRRDFDTYGLSVRWTPSPRTLAEVGAEERYFGRAHRVNLSYRTPRTLWSYADVRDVNDGGGVLGIGETATLYSVLFQQFASREPDPVLRDLLVQQELRALGRTGNERLLVGSLLSSLIVQRRQDLAVVWTSPRSAFSLQASRSQVRQLADASTLQPILTPDSTQYGYAAGFTHRLTPTASVALDASRLSTRSESAGGGTSTTSVGIGLTERLGPRASAGVRAGYTRFDSNNDPSRETSLTATLSLRF